MKNTKRFKIIEFINPSGSRAYRVSGTLDGKTIRKNFKTKSEAVAFRQKMDVEFLNQESNGQTIWTTLTHDQNRDAIAAINLLKKRGSSKSLTDAVKYLVPHYNEAAESKGVEEAVEEAVEEYLVEKKRELDREIISPPHYRSVRLELGRFRTAFAGQVVEEITTGELKTYLDEATSKSKKPQSLKTWNNRRGYLSTFFKYCLHEQYVGADPTLQIPQYKVKSPGLWQRR